MFDVLILVDLVHKGECTLYCFCGAIRGDWTGTYEVPYTESTSLIMEMITGLHTDTIILGPQELPSSHTHS